jgi:Kef-type K+ transport system membrane component KefB
MSSIDFIKLIIQITIILGLALLFGQIMRRLKQPAVLGEILVGIFLGSTILGFFFPGVYNWLFRSSRNVDVVREAFIKMGMLFFMFTIGLQVKLSDLREQWKKSLIIGLVGTLLPIVAGVGLVYLLPRNFWGESAQGNLFTFSLFIGINLANSANPVIARILMDIGYLGNSVGTIIMSATVVDDIVNWVLFALILNTVSPEDSLINFNLNMNILPIIAALIISWVFIKKSIGWVRIRVAWPGGFITYIILIILMGSFLAEFIGMHAFLGAFLVGVLLADNDEENHEAYDVIGHYSSSYFAPIYFASIGISVNFVNNFDWKLVFVVLIAALITKFGSVVIGARFAGMKIDRQVMSIASGLNARGATGIILAGVGLTNGLINDRIFVAIFIMALVTTFMSGSMMKFFLYMNRRNVNLVENL